MYKASWEKWARSLKRNIHALWLAGRDPRVSLWAKLIIGVTAAYALSPVDLIPDFIPVLGYLDDLLLLPLGIWLAIRLVPPEVWKECQARAARSTAPPASRVAAIVIVVLWSLVLASSGLWLYKLVSASG